MNYLELVNKDNLIKDSYLNDLKLVDIIDIYNCPIKVEEETYKAYLKLKEFLESINIYVGIESAYRTIEEQQKVIDEFKEKYGEEYVLKYVAPIKTSEHHTGLAIDLNIKIDNKYSEESQLIEARKVTYEEIHKHLYKYGFILRYPRNKENITGYNYEMWHIRYVGLEPAKYIYENNLTLEEYIKRIDGSMKIKNIINEFIVKNVEDSIKFYEEYFGFKTTMTDGNPIVWAQLENGNYTIMFNSYDDIKGALKDYPEKSNTSNIVMFEYENPEDLKQIYETFKSKNIEFFEEYTVTDYGKIEFGIYDLDKNLIMISAMEK